MLAALYLKAMKTLKIVSVTIVATLLIEVLLAYSYYKIKIVPDQEKAMKQVSSSFGNLSCFSSQRSGKMDSNESELFGKMRQACIENDIVKLNAYLFIKEDELQIECANDGSTYFEPNVPISKVVISNTSERPIPLIDFQIANNGWSTTSDNGRWILDYDIGMKNNPSYIKILQPGEEYKHEVPLDVRGYGKQVIKYYFYYPKWLELSSSNSRKTSITATRKECIYYWKEKV